MNPLSATAAPPPTETVLNIFGLYWSMNTIVSSLLAIIGIITLVFIAYQSFLSRKAREVAALHMRYTMIFENNKFIFENPEYVHLSMSARRYMKVKDFNHQQRKNLAAFELLLDNFEFYYLVGLHENKHHARLFARKLVENPALADFLKSEFRGTFRKDFEKIIDEVLKDHHRTYNYQI